VLESSGGLASTVDELERFDDRLREDPAVLGLCSSRDVETKAITVTFMVAADEPDDVIQIASDAFATALGAAGFDEGTIERIELEPADEPLLTAV
jgi:hypothetical protein